MLCKQTYSKFPFRNFSTFGFSGRMPKAFYRTIFPKKFLLETRSDLCVEGSALYFLSLIDFQRLSSEISSPHFYRQSLGYKAKSPLPLWAACWAVEWGVLHCPGFEEFPETTLPICSRTTPFYFVQLYLHLPAWAVLSVNLFAISA